MSNAITFQPNRLSARYSAGKLSEEDLIRSDNQTEYQEQNNDNGEGPENPKARPRHERATDYKEDTCCDYMVNICQCTSWLCANLVSSIVMCFENCIDFVHTCKCNNLCCDVCGGSEQSLEDNNKMTGNGRMSDLSENYEDEYYVICENALDIEEVLPDSDIIVETHQTPEIDGGKLTNMSNNQKQDVSENNKESWI